MKEPSIIHLHLVTSRIPFKHLSGLVDTRNGKNSALQPFNPELKKHRPESKVAIYGRTVLLSHRFPSTNSRTVLHAGRHGALVKDDATLFKSAARFSNAS